MNTKIITQAPIPIVSTVKDTTLDPLLDDCEYFDSEFVLASLVDQVNNICDINQLKQMVIEKEKELHLAATLGFAIAKKNEELEAKLQLFSQSHSTEHTEEQMEKVLLMNQVSENGLLSAKLSESEDRIKSLNKTNRDMHRELKAIREEFMQFRSEVDNVVGEMSSMQHQIGDAKVTSTAFNKRLDYIEQDLELTKESVFNFQDEVEQVVQLQQQQNIELGNELRLVQDQIITISQDHNGMQESITSLDKRQSHLESKMTSLIDEYALLLDDAQSTIHSLSESRLEASPLPFKNELSIIEQLRAPPKMSDLSLPATPVTPVPASPVPETPKLKPTGLFPPKKTPSVLSRGMFASPLDGLKYLVATKGLGDVTKMSTSPSSSPAPVRVLHSYNVL
ncbi:hypothetical protein K493DRAFT_313031 [Basidiobolus meristosporus CBS 931.73]|uniref:Uncharacterized protein n=1 Tax=Basidiobolus meristosporus CBS 931.73 TaxID=1314790 RepID=A0A1Y1YQA8_9FUNG|nr:hypothetical protein K493DRAFT_313031 [Basidiobolus meristosporus CBS 931.73]|eukprot:ORX99936.1 hypothetical protein K493DRAFT_313031 [Basidiobolus meristosporus CBS 931.73]